MFWNVAFNKEGSNSIANPRPYYNLKFFIEIKSESIWTKCGSRRTTENSFFDFQIAKHICEGGSEIVRNGLTLRNVKVVSVVSVRSVIKRFEMIENVRMGLIQGGEFVKEEIQNRVLIEAVLSLDFGK